MAKIKVIFFFKSIDLINNTKRLIPIKALIVFDLSPVNNIATINKIATNEMNKNFFCFSSIIKNPIMIK